MTQCDDDNWESEHHFLFFLLYDGECSCVRYSFGITASCIKQNLNNNNKAGYLTDNPK